MCKTIFYLTSHVAILCLPREFKFSLSLLFTNTSQKTALSIFISDERLPPKFFCAYKTISIPPQWQSYSVFREKSDKAFHLSFLSACMYQRHSCRLSSQQTIFVQKTVSIPSHRQLYSVFQDNYSFPSLSFLSTHIYQRQPCPCI